MLLLSLIGSFGASRQPKPSYVTAYPRSSTHLPLALFLFLFSVYLLTYSPRFHSSDGLAVFATAESLVRRGEWDADQIRWMGLGQGILGVDGHLYTRKGVGQSLLSLPLVWLGMLIPFWGPATTVLLFNSIVTAATAMLLFHYLRALDYDDRVALIASLTFGLGTLAWPYAKTCFSDPLAALCLLVAALALLHYRQTGRARHILWAGLALALAIAARYANAALIPLFALLLLLYQVSKASTGKPTPNPQPPAPPPGPCKGCPHHPWRAWLAFAAPLAVAAAALAYYNLARYGDPFNTGYLPEESFSGVWLQGLAGLLISPGRGLFLYAPVLLLALPSFPVFVRRHRFEGALAVGIILAHMLLYGKWFMWHGGYAWGPRFMVPTIPFFMVGLAPFIQWTQESRGRRVAFLALAILSGLIQVLGLSVHFELFQNRLLDTGLPLFAPITFFAPRYSPLVGQFQFLRPEYLDFAWILNGRINWPLLVALAVGVLLSGWSLLGVGKLKSWNAGSLLIITAWLLVHVHTLHADGLRAVVGVLNDQATAADALITGTPEEAVSFSDLYKGGADVLGLTNGKALDGDTVAALNEIVQGHPRIWWLPNWLPPDQSDIEKWLMQRGFRAEDRVIGGRRLAMYYFPSEPLTEYMVNTVFAGAIVLDRADLPTTAYPGGVLPVLLHWRARQPVSANYHVFLHLLDAQGNRAAQSDSQPALGSRPTSTWQPGELIEDRYGISLPNNLPAGDYTLIAGLYLPDSGKRLLTQVDEDHIVIGRIRMMQ